MLLSRLLPAQLPHEHVVFELRRHWSTFVVQAVVYFGLLILPAALAMAITRWYPELWAHLFNQGLTEAIVRLALSLYYLGVWAFFWNAWVDYYLDIWVITTERVLSLEQHGLFHREVAELSLSRVQDVTSRVKGFWATMLHFGEVKVQTAGEEANFIFRDIPHPYEVAERLMRLVDQWKQNHPGGNGS